MDIMAITAADVKQLRDMTGAGMMDCKKALEETGGDFDKAVDALRARGAAKAAKRAGKEASEGAIGGHTTEDGRIAGMVEVNCETDFVARNEEFQALAAGLAEHVAEAAPSDAGSGEELLGQPYAGDGKSVGEVVTQASSKTGEKIVVRRYVRYETDDGTLGSYVHMNGKIGVLVEVAGTGTAVEVLARDLAMHVAASAPLAVDRAGVPEDVVEKERSVYLEQARAEGKPEHIRDRIVEGKLNKFYTETALLEQPFVKDTDKSVGELLSEVGATAGQEVAVRRFARFALGE